MKTEKEKVIRNFLRIIFSIAILGLAVNCPKLEAYASSTVNVRIVGRSWYGAAKLMVEDINQHRKQYGAPSFTLDADLQEWATQMAAELAFYPTMAASHIRPDGTSVYSTLFTKPVNDIFIADFNTASSSDEEFKNNLGSRFYNSYFLEDTFNTNIGIGLYEDISNPHGHTYAVFLFSNSNTNTGSYKSTVETETRTISTLVSNFNLCNGKDGAYMGGHETHKITLEVGESDKTGIFQCPPADSRHFMLDNTQATYKVADPSIVSVVPTVNEIKLTGLKAGTTTFTASLDGQTVSYRVTVTGKQTSSGTPTVKKLKDLPKNYQGPAIVGGEEVYVKNQKKYSGTCKIDGKTCLYKNGKKFTGTKKGVYYKGGEKYTGWLKKGGKKYYYSKGKMVKNKFKTIKKKKYYFNKKGVTQTGQVKIKGKYYYFNKSGVMQKNKWVKIGKYKYYFNAKGIRTKKLWTDFL